MALMISDEIAERFAQALVSHAGNRSKAAIACGYRPGEAARSAGRDLARHPTVLKHLQPIAQSQLSSLTPLAIQTLAGLLTNKSGYIRLEAAKDILNRNGVGLSHEPMRSQPLVVRINLSAAAPAANALTVIDNVPSDASPQLRPGGRKSALAEGTRSDAYDFPQKGDLPSQPEGTIPQAASRVLELDLEDADVVKPSEDLDL